MTKYVSTWVYNTIRNMNCQWITIGNMVSNTAKELFKLQQSQQPGTWMLFKLPNWALLCEKKKASIQLKKKKWLEQTSKDETENKKEALVCNHFWNMQGKATLFNFWKLKSIPSNFFFIFCPCSNSHTLSAETQPKSLSHG